MAKALSPPGPFISLYIELLSSSTRTKSSGVGQSSGGDTGGIGGEYFDGLRGGSGGGSGDGGGGQRHVMGSPMSIFKRRPADAGLRTSSPGSRINWPGPGFSCWGLKLAVTVRDSALAGLG